MAFSDDKLRKFYGLDTPSEAAQALLNRYRQRGARVSFSGQEALKSYGLGKPLSAPAQAMYDRYQNQRNRYLLAELFQNSGQTERAREVMQSEQIPEPLNKLLFKNHLR